MIISETYNSQDNLPALVENEIGLVARDDKWEVILPDNTTYNLLGDKADQDSILMGDSNGKVVPTEVKGDIALISGEFKINDSILVEHVGSLFTSGDSFDNTVSIKHVDFIQESDAIYTSVETSQSIIDTFYFLNRRVNSKKNNYTVYLKPYTYEFDTNYRMDNSSYITVSGSTDYNVKLKGTVENILVYGFSIVPPASVENITDLQIRLTVNVVSNIQVGDYICFDFNPYLNLPTVSTLSTYNLGRTSLRGAYKIASIDSATNEVSVIIPAYVFGTNQTIKWKLPQDAGWSTFFGVNSSSYVSVNNLSTKVLKTVLKADLTNTNLIWSNSETGVIVLEDIVIENAADVSGYSGLLLTDASKAIISGSVVFSRCGYGITSFSGSKIIGDTNTDPTLYVTDCTHAGISLHAASSLNNIKYIAADCTKGIELYGSSSFNASGTSITRCSIGAYVKYDSYVNFNITHDARYYTSHTNLELNYVSFCDTAIYVNSSKADMDCTLFSGNNRTLLSESGSYVSTRLSSYCFCGAYVIQCIFSECNISGISENARSYILSNIFNEAVQHRILLLDNSECDASFSVFNGNKLTPNVSLINSSKCKFSSSEGSDSYSGVSVNNDSPPFFYLSDSSSLSGYGEIKLHNNFYLASVNAGSKLTLETVNYKKPAVMKAINSYPDVGIHAAGGSYVFINSLVPEDANIINGDIIVSGSTITNYKTLAYSGSIVSYNTIAGLTSVSDADSSRIRIPQNNAFIYYGNNDNGIRTPYSKL